MRLKYILLPDKQNRKRAPLVRNEFLLSYIFFIFALFVCSTFLILSVPSVLGYATDISTGDLLRYTNSRRADIGLNKLELNEDLSKAAEMKANDMFEKDYWAHTSPTGKEPWDFIIANGYDYLYAGENLAVDFSHSKSVVDAWYESPSHKANLLNDNYTEIGFAVVNGELQGRKTTLVVQMFGYPRNRVVAVQAEGENSTSKELAIETEPASTEQNVENPLLAKNPENNIVPATGSEITAEEETPNLIKEETYITIPEVKTDSGSVLNTSTVFNFSRFVAILLGIFITGMFAIDGFYVRKNGILRLTGHTIFHVLILLFALIGMWYTTIGLVL